MLVLGLALPAWAADDTPESLRDQDKGEHGRQVMDSLDFILSIGLDGSQARAILPLYEEACRLHARNYADRSEILPLEVQAYAAFLIEDRLNRGFSPEVEGRTARIHHRAIVVREKLAEDLNALSDDIWSLLTRPQQAAAEAYKPGRKAVFATFADPKEQRNVARSALRTRRHGPPPPRPEDPAIAAARKEVARIDRFVHPQQDNVASHLLSPAAAEWLYELAGVQAPPLVHEAVRYWRYGARDYPLARCRQDEAALRELRKEINNWNLTNGMYFSRSQMEQLVALAQEAERIEAVQRQIRPRGRLHPDQFAAQQVRLELAAEAVLRPGQRKVMEDYKPCLIPPKNLKDPVRVGQAADTSHLAEWLASTRGKGDVRIEEMINRLIEGEIDRLGPMDEPAVEARRELLRETARQVADMTEVEFALNKDDLAEEIQPVDRKKTLIAAIDDMRRVRSKPGRTYEFLLNCDFADVLKVRYQQLASAR